MFLGYWGASDSFCPGEIRCVRHCRKIKVGLEGSWQWWHLRHAAEATWQVWAAGVVWGGRNSLGGAREAQHTWLAHPGPAVGGQASRRCVALVEGVALRGQ